MVKSFPFYTPDSFGLKSTSLLKEGGTKIQATIRSIKKIADSWKTDFAAQQDEITPSTESQGCRGSITTEPSNDLLTSKALSRQSNIPALQRLLNQRIM